MGQIRMNIEAIISKVDLRNKASIMEAANQLIGLNNVSEGDEVTVTDNDYYPFEGQVGRVTKVVPEQGVAHVKFPNVAEPVVMMTNLLIPVNK